MRYMAIPVCILVLFGCGEVPTPQEKKEHLAQTAIKKNMDEALKARSEYLALQKKRHREDAL